MLARYTIYRGKRPEQDPLSDGIRQDTRKHTRHVLRPPAQLVVDYLEAPDDAAWEQFCKGYRKELQRRYPEDSEPFGRLAALASVEEVFIGCSCPTKRNPKVRHCHTYLALQFMKEKFPVMPERHPEIFAW